MEIRRLTRIQKGTFVIKNELRPGAVGGEYNVVFLRGGLGGCTNLFGRLKRMTRMDVG